MNIENEIFQKSKIDLNKLLSYGFIKQNENYIISKKICNDTFRVDIVVSELGVVKGKIFDLNFESEYTNHRLENQKGQFVSKIKEEFKNILIDIREKCTTPKYFFSNQANRIASNILKLYKDSPEFLWPKFPGCGVFRSQRNAKWYAAIMNIKKNKIAEGEEEVEILNVKLKEEEIQSLLKEKNFYPAYHMNKKNWITILLDDTLKDDEIMYYIKKSYELIEQRKDLKN